MSIPELNPSSPHNLQDYRLSLHPLVDFVLNAQYTRIILAYASCEAFLATCARDSKDLCAVHGEKDKESSFIRAEEVGPSMPRGMRIMSLASTG
jgi:hypothetical protein